MTKIDDFKPLKPAVVTVPLEESDDTVTYIPVEDRQAETNDVALTDDNTGQDELPSEEKTGENIAPSLDEERQLGDTEQVMEDSGSPKSPGKFKRFCRAFWRKKKWTIPFLLLVLIGVVFAVPYSRYPLLALVLKRSYIVSVVDSRTDTPVSGATITLDGYSATTDSSGNAKLNVKVGKRILRVTKQYYKASTAQVFVGLSSSKNTTVVHLVATGRQVPIKVVNKITGKPIDNAQIKVLNTEAKTDASGKATIVLPTNAPTQDAIILANGYNNLSGSVSVTSSVVNVNTFSLVPAGRVYFLSNLSGKIDVVSTNLDGSGRQTVLAGTGNEDPNDTSLLASTDWKYLALLSKRDSSQNAKLYLISTANNQLTTVDGGGTDRITLIGWSGHNFVYQLTNGSLQNWQSGKTVLKSYNADTGKITTIDQTSADGTVSAYEFQSFSFANLVNDKVVYGLTWNSLYNGGINVNNKNMILSAGADGSNKITLESLSIAANTASTYMAAVATKPGNLDILTNNGGGQDIFYTYNYGNNTVTQSNTISDATFGQEQQTQVTYLVSPSGNQTFWAAQRDGKNSLFIGDNNGNNANQIASLSSYTTYGWFTDKYLLVEKGGNELFVMPVGGGQALKISDYYKPPINYYGYGGGYGGL